MQRIALFSVMLLALASGKIQHKILFKGKQSGATSMN
jgi:hypothetical protein